MKFALYLSKDNRENYEIALRWAFNKGLINKQTNWAFTKFSVMNVIDMILKEIAKEQIEKESTELALRASNPDPFHPKEIRSG